MMRVNTAAAVALLTGILVLSSGCVDRGRPLWHDVKLPSGKTVKVTSFHLVWGVEHDERDVSKDSFALEYVATEPGAEVARREAEAAEVFELVRPASEQWGFRTASVAAFPEPERKGRYDVYLYERQSDGRWTFTRTAAKVFVTD